MGSHTLTTLSESGNRDNVILKPASGVGVVVNNTDNLIIKDISIDNTASASYGVHFTELQTILNLETFILKAILPPHLLMLPFIKLTVRVLWMIFALLGI